MPKHPKNLWNIVLGAASLGFLVSFSVAQTGSTSVTSEYIPAGQKITPTAVPGSQIQVFNPGLTSVPLFRPSGGVTTLLSPDNKTLLALLAGTTFLTTEPAQRRPVLEGNICLFSTYHTAPLQQQVIKIPNTFVGMVFDP